MKETSSEREREMGKHKLEPPASNFFAPDASHSEVLGASDSLSLPSEPPDIRNWFSSYVYQSPELNTSDDFEAHVLRGTDCVEKEFDGEEKTKQKEENLGEFGANRTKDEMVIGEGEASNCFAKSNDAAEDHNHGNKNANQVPGSSDFLSLGSEPPHITRWFSSYVYESPLLDTSDHYGGSNCIESEFKRVMHNSDNCSKTNGEDAKRDLLATDKKLSSNGLVECNSSDRDNKYDHQYSSKEIHGIEDNKISSILKNLPEQMISGEVLEGKPTNFDVSSIHNAEKSSLHSQLCIENKRGNREADNDGRLVHRKDSIEESAVQTAKDGDLAQARNLDMIENTEDSVGKSTCGNKENEKNGQIFAENGFISTRNSRSARTNGCSSLGRPMNDQYGCLRNSVTVVNKKATATRKPLSEATNFRHVDALEFCGKWQCPQKRKPKLGPPLKQLRLEQWVHRI